MSSDKKLLQDQAQIDSLNELETAKKRAQINAAQDKLLLKNSLGEIKDQGPKVLLQNIVLPVAAVALGTYGVVKIISSLTKSDSRDYYAEPTREYMYDYEQSRQANLNHEQAFREAPSSGRKRSAVKSLAVYLPVAIKLTKMAVSYLEKNGTKVHPVLHDLLAGPGVSSEQRT